jgi:hypothetical protein
MLALLVFCGPPTLEMALMRPASINFNPMWPLGQFEFETPGLNDPSKISCTGVKGLFLGWRGGGRGSNDFVSYWN